MLTTSSGGIASCVPRSRVLAEADLRGRDLDGLVGPDTAESRVGPALHVRFLHQEHPVDGDSPFLEQRSRECDIFTGVRGPCLGQDAVGGHAALDRDAREDRGFRLGPEPARDCALPSREHEPRRESLKVQFRAAFGYHDIVAAEDNDDVGRCRDVVQPVIVPDALGQRDHLLGHRGMIARASALVASAHSNGECRHPEGALP